MYVCGKRGSLRSSLAKSALLLDTFRIGCVCSCLLVENYFEVAYRFHRTLRIGRSIIVEASN